MISKEGCCWNDKEKRYYPMDMVCDDIFKCTKCDREIEIPDSEVE